MSRVHKTTLGLILSLVLFPAVSLGQEDAPSSCVNLLTNSDFETSSSWTPGRTKRPAIYTSEYKHAGARSMLLGIPVASGNAYTYSSIMQVVQVPSDTESLYLQWWQWGGSEEGESATPSRTDDRHDVILLTDAGIPIEILQRIRSNERAWSEATVTLDATAYSGRYIAVYINAYNDGDGGRTWLYVDDLRLISCTGVLEPAPTPIATITPVPSPTPPPNIICSYDAYNCSDFLTREEAQGVFDYCMVSGYGDIHRLDFDNDLIACEEPR